MRLGDLDALFYKLVNTDPNTKGKFCDGVAKAMEFILNEPTIDAVPVVRCVECKHRDPENHHCDHPAGATVYFPRKDDDFCSYGERKDGDGNGPA